MFDTGKVRSNGTRGRNGRALAAAAMCISVSDEWHLDIGKSL